MNKSIILLSGGLDSIVALGECKEKYGIELAITFDYGQKALKEEVSASKSICDFYEIKHKIIKLDWLKEISNSSLVTDSSIPENNFESLENTKSVWIPNRNGLFLNIAACYADSYGYNYIIFGANKDEATTFPDNTEEFRYQISKTFETSTLVKPKVIAPLINYTKNDIVKIAIKRGIPLEFVRSCYNSGTKHCGKCASCNHLKNALLENNCTDIIEKIFE